MCWTNGSYAVHVFPLVMLRIHPSSSSVIRRSQCRLGSFLLFIFNVIRVREALASIFAPSIHMRSLKTRLLNHDFSKTYRVYTTGTFVFSSSFCPGIFPSHVASMIYRDGSPLYGKARHASHAVLLCHRVEGTFIE